MTEIQTDNQETDNQAIDKMLINCDQVVDISVVNELHDHLKQAIANKQNVEIDAGEVERVDAAVLQLFYSFIEHSKMADISVEWKRVSDAFRKACELLGLSTSLDLPA